MSFMLLGGSLGVVGGYMGTVILQKSFKWQATFMFNALISATCSVIMSVIPGHYLNIDQAIKFLADVKKKR